MARAAKKTEKGIECRGPHQYRARVRRGDINEYRTFETLEAAKRWQEHMVGKIAGHEYVDRSLERRTTLAELLKRYLKDETPKKKPSGALKEKYRINAWLREEFTKLPLVSIDPSYFTAWRARQVEAGKAPSTISNPMNIMSAVFKIARTEWGYKIDNPLTGIARPAPKAPREVFLSIKEEAVLLEHCRIDSRPAWLYTMVKLAIWTAMRQGEIRSLRWEWIDLDAGLATLPSDTVELGKKDGVVKNGAGRSVVLLDEAEATLRAWAGDNVPSAGLVFTDAEGQELSQDTVTKAFSKVAEAAGRPDLTFHDQRHVATTRLKLVHDDALHLSKTTGHKDLRSLARYYNPDPVENAAVLRAKAREKFGRKAQG